MLVVPKTTIEPHPPTHSPKGGQRAMFLTGFIAACAIIFLLLKFNFRRVLQHDISIDIAVTVILCMLFAGTFAGMMTGLVAGCIISIFLYVSKRFMGYERFGIIKTDSFPYRKFGWINVPPGGKR